eukprot:416155-Alexandrium_andersonii.AAC.1
MVEAAANQPAALETASAPSRAEQREEQEQASEEDLETLRNTIKILQAKGKQQAAQAIQASLEAMAPPEFAVPDPVGLTRAKKMLDKAHAHAKR